MALILELTESPVVQIQSVQERTSPQQIMLL